MRLSNDGKAIIDVTNEDIVNGILIIPEGININHYACEKLTSLTAVIFPECVDIGTLALVSAPA